MTYERMVLMEEIQRLPGAVEADIAVQVSNFLEIAKAAKGEALLAA